MTWVLMVICCYIYMLNMVIHDFLLFCISSILLFKGLPLFGILIFFNAKISLHSYVYVEIKLKDNSVKINIYISILLFKELPLFKFLIFQFKNASTPLCLSRNKTKGYSSKNPTLTPTKTSTKKQDYSPVIFQTILSIYKLELFFKKKKNTYKLDSQNKNTFFFC